ncbi:ATP-binding cassette domain-containing protein [Pseudomonas cannabina]|uniref:ABC transporter, ATP-binding protein-related protein n=1 Tax=Pseudomonas cannabina TaxID=86840 RepID=A0A0P9Q3N0_PSECA|nr:ATP-binding cassette domain-containing protein [Pseudomonas cannabina]KAA8713164.1 ATP-binding cassette domain-containing protein [Pseudomonas cannabina]KPW64640.1 ABC transporter, ATP-binding protein-related protein [Pseudomonas cannabina]
MSFSFSIPINGPKDTLKLTVNAGQMLFVLGANGTGKSSLLQLFASVGGDQTRRITAHRQTWFRSGSPTFTGKQRADYGQHVLNHDRQVDARWKDEYSEQRAQMAIYDLVNSENVRAREITRAVDAKKVDDIERLSAKRV